ncbi:hypothetical protein Tco_0248041 [Tanacetum coccineum]
MRKICYTPSRGQILQVLPNHPRSLPNRLPYSMRYVGTILITEEEKRIVEEQAAKDRYWKILICYDDDEDDTIGITPVLPIKEPDDSLSMGDEHLDTVPATESDEVIKSSVDGKKNPPCSNIPSVSEGIPAKIDDDSSYGENIDYVDASPPDVEIVSLEVVEIIVPEVGRIDDDILLTIKDRYPS